MGGIDFYDNSIKGQTGGPIRLSQTDSAQYLTFMANEAAKFNISTGLKNALALLPRVQNNIQFAVNEECVAFGHAAPSKSKAGICNARRCTKHLVAPIQCPVRVFSAHGHF